MRVARAASMLADLETSDLGPLDLAAALAAFDSFPWDEQIRFSAELDAEGKDCVFPDLTFRVDRWHLVVAATEEPGAFRVEVCVPQAARLLGLISRERARFYEFRRVSGGGVREMLRVFFQEPHESQHTYFGHQGELSSGRGMPP
jgi:hypothetical protein